MKNILINLTLVSLLSAGALAVESPVSPTADVKPQVVVEHEIQNEGEKANEVRYTDEIEELELHFDAVEFDTDFVPFKLESDTESV